MLGSDHILLLVGTAAEDQESELKLEPEVPGWRCLHCSVDGDIIALVQAHRCEAVVLSPSAIAALSGETLAALSSLTAVLVGELPFTAPLLRTLRQLAARKEFDEANLFFRAAVKVPDRISAEARVQNSFAALLEQYDYQTRVFNYITSTTPDFIYVFNRQGQFIYANQRLLTVWGRRLDEVIGKTCIELGYEQWHHDMHMREIAEVIETRGPVRGEVPYKAPLTGIFGVYEYIFTPVLAADGEVEVVAGITRDITERKASEEDLRQSKYLLEVALAASSTGTFRWDPNNNEFLAMDDTFRDIFGIEPGDEVQTSFDIFNYIHEDDREAVAEAVKGVGEGRDLLMEFRIAKPKGAITWVYDRAKAIRDNNGAIVYVVGACTDITRLKEIELELRAAEQQRQFIMESMPQKIFVTGPAGEPLYNNSVWVDYTGLSYNVMQNWPQFIHPDDLENSVKAWQHSLASGEPFYMEHRFRNRDGAYRWHVSRANAMKNADGAVQLWIGSSTDIDDMKVAQQQLEEREDRLATLNLELQQARDTALAASAAKSMFLASMSHELRTPLNAIIGYSEMLRDELTETKDESVVADLNKILLSGKHLLAVISDILDISKIEAGKMEFEVETFDVHQVVLEAKLLVMPLVERNNNCVEVHCVEGQALMLTTDRVRLRQILFNLLSNAAKFTTDGTIAIHCRLLPGADTRHVVEISVADTGIGIPADKMKELFEEFSQLESGTHRMFGGTGLGLAISRRLCQLLGGNITAYSDYGKGSVFTVRLPVHTDLSVCRVDPNERVG
jgi:PAS domain S-box-containing protein